MSNKKSQFDFHSNSVSKLTQEIKALEEKLRNFSVIRLVLIVAGFIGCFLAWPFGILPIFGVLNIIIIGFIVVSFQETKLNNKATFCKKRREVFEHEIKLLNRDFNGLDEGAEFIKPGHNFSHDLDIFGFKSLFQLLNRTSTFKGKQLLGSWLNKPLTNKEKINQKQAAVKELASKDNWCYELLAYGKSSNDKADTQSTIDEWINDQPIFQSALIKITRIILPIITVSIGVCSYFEIVDVSIFTTAFLIQLAISGRYASRVSKIQGKLGSRFAIIENYIKIVNTIENQSFNSDYLKKLQGVFKNENQTFSVSASLIQLKKLLDKLDTRLNIYLAIVLNGLFLWDINIVYQVEQWKNKNKENLGNWMHAVGEFDAITSLALFASNHPGYTYPAVSKETNSLNCENFGHPMIEDSKLVKNNYVINGNGKVDLLTGANMAGKSTFLRTVGVNLILARIGAPVCADKFEFTPFKLFSSLRTVDSLKDNESFFYAELKRLKQLIDLYADGEKVFFLLDEILKGTNSADQHKGSVGLIKKLIKQEGTGIIATHDIELANLTKESPENVRNLCFEIEIINDQLKFDYTVKPGFCTTMNASFLMESMGII